MGVAALTRPPTRSRPAATPACARERSLGLARLALALCLFATTTASACVIDGCHDGDSCKLRCDDGTLALRLYCIDAPELGQQPWGRIARDALRAEVRGTIRILVDDVDRHNRVVADLVHEDGHNLGLELVRQGHAAVYPKHCDEAGYYAAE